MRSWLRRVFRRRPLMGQDFERWHEFVDANAWRKVS